VQRTLDAGDERDLLALLPLEVNGGFGSLGSAVGATVSSSSLAPNANTVQPLRAVPPSNRSW